MAENTVPMTKKVSCHAWNGAGNLLAMCPGNKNIEIYNFDGSKFSLCTVLKQHDAVVSSLDWHPETNLLVSCSHDRNAYVWTQVAGGASGSGAAVDFTPNLCVLNNNRAAICVKWSHNGKKFAVGSGSGQVSVCSFEEEENWWVPRTMRLHKSAVLSLAWHPNDVILASCGADGKCIVSSAHIRECDGSGSGVPKFKTVLLSMDYTNGAWINDVEYSPSGETLCFVSHDATMFFVRPAELDESGAPFAQKLVLRDLPMRCVLFVGENSLVGAGDDCNPFVFVREGGSWSVNGSFGKAAGAFSDLSYEESEGSLGESSSSGSNFSAAFARFQSATKFGEGEQRRSAAGQASRAKVAASVHKCPIENLKGVGSKGPGVISSSAVDGRVVLWHLDRISAGQAALRA